HGGEAADDGVIAHLHVPGQGAVIRKNNVVSNYAIVCNVAVGEEGAAVADPRFALAGCAAADCDKFAERIFIADFQVSRFALIFQVLRLLTDRAGRVKFVPRTGAHRSAKRDMLLQPAVLAKHNVRTYHAIGTDDRSGADFCSRIDDRRGMNLPVAHSRKPLTLILSP